ncbi:carbohydrate kinase family protein [Saccharopolyspora elongata]|uniref:Carbohydrate kinase n=1 Tax=Saccharopolyspora elongata TaxID=2530387 RepID=A0A4R4Y1U2_9PSEU|nr:PfkB family carbohydrate kinase [Saccharopolyspora elongata]TDD38075.1 carbohydrate kinase [Saccharopolyspora elongata]
MSSRLGPGAPAGVASPAAELADVAGRARVLLVGSLNVDTILLAQKEPDDEGAVLVTESITSVGGHAGNCASAFAALGVRAGLVAAVGADEHGDWIVADLAERGVDTSLIVRHPGASTGHAVIPVFDEKHYMLLVRGANELLTEAHLGAIDFAGYDAVVLFDPSRAALQEAVRLARAAPHRPLLCWNPGGIYSRDPVIAELLPECDVVLANRDEFGHLQRALETAGRARDDQDFVITLGDGGSRLVRSGRRWDCPSVPVEVVDPTGAGDAFAASYVLAALAGFEPELRLRLGNRAGALAVTAPGARGHLAALSEVVGALT